MPPFLQFRLWLRQGPRGERLLAGIVAAVVLAVVGLALVPVSSGTAVPSNLVAGPSGTAGGGSTTTSTAGGRATGTATTAGQGTKNTGGTGTVAGPGLSGSGATSGAGGPTGTHGAGPKNAHGTGAGSTTGHTVCGTLTASAPGVTSTEIHLDMANISLAGPIGNSTFDIRPDMPKIESAVAADINAHGGVACGRKLVLKQYDVNPLDSNDSQAKCLQMSADHPFMVVNFGAYVTPASRQCFVQNKVLEESATQVDLNETRSSYPYLFSPYAYAEQEVDAAIFGFASRGVFRAPKFTKLGVFEDGCDPPVNKEIATDLAKVGVKSSQISTYVLDCDVASPPNQIEQGVLQHKFAHASHVLLASSGTNGQNYVRVANNQGYHPQYLVSDYGANTTGAGTENWGGPFNGALGLTTTRVGEFSSGIHNAQERRCDLILRQHGVKGISAENKDTSAMEICDLIWLVQQAFGGAGSNPTQLSFLQGLAGMGLFRSVQMGDGNFNRAGKVTGGDYEREIVYRSTCGCWHIVDPTMRPLGG